MERDLEWAGSHGLHLTQDPRAVADDITVGAAMRALCAASRALRLAAQPLSPNLNSALGHSGFERIMRAVWNEACLTYSALVENTIYRQADASSADLLRHALELALIDRCAMPGSGSDDPQEVLAFAASAVLWRLRWLLIDYRRPTCEWIHSLASCHSLLRFSEPRTSQQVQRRREAMSALSQCFILAAADPHTLSPRELHALSDALPRLADATGELLTDKACAGPAAMLDVDNCKLRLVQSFETEKPVLHLPLTSLLDPLRTLAARSDSMNLALTKLARRLEGDQPRRSERTTCTGGLVTIGFFPILGTERRWVCERINHATEAAKPCTVIESSVTGASVSLLSANLRAQPGQLASLEVAGGTWPKRLAVVRWVRREPGVPLTLGLEFLHPHYSIQVLRSHDVGWPCTGLRVQQAIVSGLQPDIVPESIEVIIGWLYSGREPAAVPKEITLTEHGICFRLAGAPSVLNGHARLTYRHVATSDDRYH